MTFRILAPHEIEGRASLFKVGERVRVHMPPYGPWEGTVSRLKWFTSDAPDDEPIYEITDAEGRPRGYSSHWMTKA